MSDSLPLPALDIACQGSAPGCPQCAKLAELVRQLPARVAVYPTLWTLARVEGVEPTNNRAERTLRPAVRIVNDSIYGLQAGIFTKNIDHALYAFNELEVGGVVINDVPSFRVDSMPYGGVKQSGLGREGVRFAMEEMTEMKLLVLNKLGRL